MTIAIFGNPYPEHFNKYIQHLIKKLEGEQIKIIIEENFYTFLKKDIRFNNKINTFDSYDTLVNNADFLFSIGGDGTLLKAVTFIRDSHIPVMGINTGRLGFISSISAGQIDDAINDILKGDYIINERILLQINTENNLFKEKNFALNEVAISKKDTSSMIKIDAFIDPDEFKTQIDDYIQTLRSTCPAPGTDGPMIPGDPEREAESIRSEHGIPLVLPVVEELRDISKRTGIPFD